jgi:uncharacterized damage-inducible protein DinB
MDEQMELRQHVLKVLRGGMAHIDLKAALKDFPLDRINDRPGNSPHSAWDLLEHLRLAQWDILEFTRNPEHESPDFPDGYWAKAEGTAESWQTSVACVRVDLRAMRELVANETTDLLAPLAHGTGQTILREALLVADHNAYHLGQIMLLKKML